MSEEIIKILDDLAKRFGIAVDWSSENVIPYLEQLCEKFINWEISTSFAWIVIMSVLTIISFIFAIILHKIDKDYVSCGIGWIIFGAVLITSLAVIGVQIFDIIECKTFPEKVIYEYIKTSIQSK